MEKTLGQRVRTLREERGISRTQLAATTKIGYSTIAEIENGGMRSTTKLHLLARALDVSVDWLATGSGPMHAGDPSAAAAPTDLAQYLAGLATPRSRRALERIIEAAKTGRLSEADLLLLESLAERFMTPAQPGAVSAALHRKAKGHAPSGA